MKKLFIIIFVFAFVSNSTAQLCFQLPNTYSVQSYPLALANADFNNDGNKDLAVANYSSTSISMLFGTGTGSFSPASSFTVTAEPTDIISSDLNNDGNADLVIANIAVSSISTLLGNGLGTFQAPVNFTLNPNTGPVQLTSADFNNDGKIDVATANFDAHNFSVFMGNGTGSFSTITTFTLSTNFDKAESIVSGDVNNDSKIDIIVGLDYGVYVLLGDGAGSFSALTSFGPAGSRGLALSDLNNDSFVDLIASNYNAGSISILFGNGSGYFNYIKDYPTTGFTGSYPTRISIADLNNDALEDISIANSGAPNVAVLIAAGAGTFYPAFYLSTGIPSVPFGIVTSDFDSDGKVDIAVANRQINNVKVFLRNNNPTNTITISSTSIVICAGETTTLVASGGTNYLWSTNQTGSTTAVSPTISTNFYITSSDPGGCYSNASYTQSVSACVGIKEYEIKNILIYPNPVSTILNIETEQSFQTGTEVEVINYLGQTVLKTAFKNEIDVSYLSDGVYTLQLISKNQVAQKRLIIAK